MRWTDKFVLEEIERALADKVNTPYKICVGHHPIHYLRGGSHSILKVKTLLIKYGF